MIANLLQKLSQGRIEEGINTQVKVVRAIINLGKGIINLMKKYQENLKR